MPLDPARTQTVSYAPRLPRWHASCQTLKSSATAISYYSNRRYTSRKRRLKKLFQLLVFLAHSHDLIYTAVTAPCALPMQSGLLPKNLICSILRPKAIQLFSAAFYLLPECRAFLVSTMRLRTLTVQLARLLRYSIFKVLQMSQRHIQSRCSLVAPTCQPLYGVLVLIKLMNMMFRLVQLILQRFQWLFALCFMIMVLLLQVCQVRPVIMSRNQCR